MPQLDKVTFLSQFFWLCFFYLGFYYLAVKYFLPKISRILTLRKKKMNLSQYGSNSLQQENQQVRQNLDNNLSRGLSLSRIFFTDFLSRTINWLDRSLKGVNKTHYKTANNSYIHSLGETSLSQNTLLYYACSDSPETLKMSKLVDNMYNIRKILISISQAKSRVKVNRVHKVSLSSQAIKDQPLLNQEMTKKAEYVQENNKKSKKSKK